MPTGSWATCILPFQDAQDWSGSPGVLIPLRAERAGVPYSILLFAGSPDSPEGYVSHQDTPTDSVGGWAMVEVPWSDFRRVDWETDPGTPLAPPDQVVGIGFGFDELDAGTNEGALWVDDLSLIGGGPSGATEPPPHSESTGRRLPCPTAPVLAALLPGAVLLRRRRR